MISKDKRGTTGHKKVSSRRAVSHRTSDTWDRLMPYLVPVVLCLSAMVISLLVHWRWGGDPVAVSLMAVAGAGLSGFTFQTWKVRRGTTRIAATAFVLVLSVWLTLAVATSPLSGSMINAWLYGTAVLSAAWGIRHAAMSRHHEEDTGESEKDTFLARLGGMFDNLKEREVNDLGNRMTAEYEIKPGSGTVEDVQGELKRAASAAGVNPSAMTITSPGPNRVVFTVQPGDPLGSGPIEYVGPSHPGKSVADAPLRFAWRMDDTPAGLWVCGDERHDRPLSHLLTVGMTGAGKSETLSTIIIEGRSRTDFVPVVADPRKFGQAYGDIEDALALSAQDEEQTLRLIENFPAVVQYRARLLGSLTRADGGRGYKQWEPECFRLHRVPLLFLVVDEAAAVISRNDDFNDGVRAFRSLGIFLVAGLQTAIGSDIDRKIRDQFGQAIAHGCKSPLDAGFVLTDETLAAGADPTKWQANKAGAFYGELAGTPKEQWHLECRALRTDRPDDRMVKRRALDASRPVWAALDEGTLYHLSNGLVTAGDAPPVKGEFTPGTKPTTTETTEAETMTNEYLRDSEYAHADTTQSIPRNLAVQDEQFESDAPDEPVPPDVAREAFDLRLELIAREQDTVKLADFADTLREIGRSSAWGYKQLTRMEQAGLIKSDPKGSRTYRILSPAGVNHPGLTP
jgi:hypothetical protein